MLFFSGRVKHSGRHFSAARPHSDSSVEKITRFFRPIRILMEEIGNLLFVPHVKCYNNYNYNSGGECGDEKNSGFMFNVFTRGL